MSGICVCVCVNTDEKKKKKKVKKRTGEEGKDPQSRRAIRWSGGKEEYEQRREGGNVISLWEVW